MIQAEKKTKFFILTFPLAFVSIMAFCSSIQSYKQVKIPLDNETGIPFYKNSIDYYIEGFDVDSSVFFYFLGGDKATLVCFKDNSLVFRKKYTELRANQIHILKNRIYVFDYKYNKNNLFVLNKKNGSIVNSYNNVIKNKVNSFLFLDTCLIVEVFDNMKRIDMSTPLGFAMFDLTGKYIKQVGNPYDLSDILNPTRVVQYLGTWINNFVYWDYNFDKKQCVFILKNSAGKTISTKNIDEKVFGQSFYGNPLEHKRFRNGNIYILSHDEKNAIITVLPIKELFNLN